MLCESSARLAFSLNYWLCFPLHLRRSGVHRGTSCLVYLLILSLKVSKNSFGDGFGAFIPTLYFTRVTGENLFQMLRPHRRAASLRNFSPQVLIGQQNEIHLILGREMPGMMHFHRRWQRWALHSCWLDEHRKGTSSPAASEVDYKARQMLFSH